MGYSVRLGIPGATVARGVLVGCLHASQKHTVGLGDGSGNGFDDMLQLWADALNAAELGAITHFVMLHSDVSPYGYWIDILLDEMDRLGADMVSTPLAIKDHRGLSSCGIGDPGNPWAAMRRITMTELQQLPEAFDAAMLGYPDKILLHNTGCWVADLRKPLFYETDENGELKIALNFPTRIIRDSDGHFIKQRESEDWYFSRKLWEAGARTYITRKVQATHRGPIEFPNYTAWGEFDNDEHTRPLWNEVQQQMPAEVTG